MDSCSGPPMWPASADASPAGDQLGSGVVTGRCKTSDPEIQVNRDVDILVVVDNSATMAEEQARLSSGLAALIDVLESPTVDANYRIGFTTTDNGNVRCAGTSPEAGTLRLSACTRRPWEFANRQGTEDHFATACAASCDQFSVGEGFEATDLLPTVTARDGEAKPRPWIERNQDTTNLPEGLTVPDAIACAAPQGIDGCGFESHLESMYKALARAETQGQAQFDFIREGAALVVLLVTDEDDCSMNPAWDEEIASPMLPVGSRLFWENPTGQASSAICWNAGVTCVGDPTGYESCEPADKGVGAPTQLPTSNDPLAGGAWPTHVLEAPKDPASNAVLFPVTRYVDLLQQYEDIRQSYNPRRQVVLGVFGGVPTHYATNERVEIEYADASEGAVQDEFGIGPGCTAEGTRAVPPVRLRAVAEAFEIDDTRNLHSVCAEDYGAAMTAIGEQVGAQMVPACVPFCVLDTDPDTDAFEPRCDVFQVSPGMNKTIVPECDGRELPEGEAVCRYLLTESDPEFSEACSERAYNVEIKVVRDPGVPVPAGTGVYADCVLSDEPTKDCPGFQG